MHSVGVDLATNTTLQLLRALDRGEVSSVELLDAMISNIDAWNPDVNAVVACDFERARAEASAADALHASNEPRGRLHGLPMTVKDCFETLDLVTTAGAPELAQHVPDRDADAVRLLRRAGAIVWAKTNVPIYASDHQTHNDVYGVTANPWDPTCTAGGSSGGAAVAVACGFSTAELGSDIGGSIRLPASLNGVFGLKTSHGLVSGRGHIPGPPGSLRSADMEVFGPIGRSCGDLRLLLEILTSSASAFGGVPGAALPTLQRPVDIDELRVGIWADDPVSPVDRVVVSVIEQAAAELESAGAEVVSDIRPAMSSAALQETYLQLLLAALPEPTGTDMSHRDWLRADEARAEAQRAWADVFDEVDVMLMPTQPVPAFPHDLERPYGDRRFPVNGQDQPHSSILFWAGLASMALLPAVALPVGRTEAGLPVGIQAVGPRWSDHQLLGVCEEIASVLGARFTPPPMVTADVSLARVPQ